jgi:hypothetical protein
MSHRSFSKDEKQSGDNLAWYYRENIGHDNGELRVCVNTQGGKWIAYMDGEPIRAGKDMTSLHSLTNTYGD